MSLLPDFLIFGLGMLFICSYCLPVQRRLRFKLDFNDIHIYKYTLYCMRYLCIHVRIYYTDKSNLPVQEHNN